MSQDSVCERAGASRSQLYHYFEDRADLIRAVVYATADEVLGSQLEHLDHLDTWAGIEDWLDALVTTQVELDARGGCPIGSLVGQLAERDEGAREALARSVRPLGAAPGRRAGSHAGARRAPCRRRSRAPRYGDDGQPPGRPAVDAGAPRPRPAPRGTRRCARDAARGDLGLTLCPAEAGEPAGAMVRALEQRVSGGGRDRLDVAECDPRPAEPRARFRRASRCERQGSGVRARAGRARRALRRRD